MPADGERLIWDYDWRDGRIGLVRQLDRDSYGIERLCKIILLCVIEPTTAYGVLSVNPTSAQLPRLSPSAYVRQ